MKPQTRIIAHRGASSEAPENTLAAFRRAWEQDADGVETDVRLTADKVPVCLHDPNTLRVSGVDHFVANTKFADLREGTATYDRQDETGICQLQELLESLPTGKQLFIEIKCGVECVPFVLREVALSPVPHDQIVLLAFDLAVVAACKAAVPEIRCLLALECTQSKSQGPQQRLEHIQTMLEQARADGINISRSCGDSGLIQALLDAGYECHVWTINSPEEAREFKNIGVTSIMTDCPGLIRQALQTASVPEESAS